MNKERAESKPTSSDNRTTGVSVTPPPSEPAPAPRRQRYRFWPILGLALGLDLILALGYTLLTAEFTVLALSNSLCVSAALLGVAAALPVVLDAGRGIGMALKLGATKEARHAAFTTERRRREQGSVVTFALAAAALVVTALSLLIVLV